MVAGICGRRGYSPHCDHEEMSKIEGEKRGREREKKRKERERERLGTKYSHQRHAPPQKDLKIYQVSVISQ
jgi:ribosomal protein L44E